MLRKTVTIGGGTGSFVLLTALKNIPELKISAIVPSTDSGGSSGKLRDLYGFLPPGDIRQCLVALAQDSEVTEVLRKLFSYRFSGTNEISGHNFGNLFLTALSDITNDQEKSIDVAGKILNIKGQVLPVTLQNSDIVAIYENGKKITGEHLIDEPHYPHDGRLRITELRSSNEYVATENSKNSIVDSDFILVAPGDLYTSIYPILIAKGVRESIQNSKSKIVYFVNLFTKFGQTYGFRASDFVRETEKYLGKKIDVIIINSQEVPGELVKLYEKYNQTIVEDDLQSDERVVRADIISDIPFDKPEGDQLFRSVVRHDSVKIENLLNRIFNKG